MMQLNTNEYDLIADALRIAKEEYMKHASHCAAEGCDSLATQFLNQADWASKLLEKIENRD